MGHPSQSILSGRRSCTNHSQMFTCWLERGLLLPISSFCLGKIFNFFFVLYMNQKLQILCIWKLASWLGSYRRQASSSQNVTFSWKEDVYFLSLCYNNNNNKDLFSSGLPTQIISAWNMLLVRIIPCYMDNSGKSLSSSLDEELEFWIYYSQEWEPDLGTTSLSAKFFSSVFHN